MARKPVSMRKAKEILRLKHEQGLTNRQIGACLNLSRVSVGKYLRRAATAGLGWPLAENVREDALDVILLAGPSTSKQARRPVPDATQIHRELQRKHVTLRLLWETPMSISSDAKKKILTRVTREVWSECNM